MSDTAVLADLDRALAAAERIVAGIGPSQWSAPTPCTELNVRDVLNHLVSGNLLFAALVRKDLAEQSLAGLRRQLSPRPEGPGAPFGPEVAVPEDAAAIDRLAGFLGRPG